MGERLTLRLDGMDGHAGQIARVDFEGFYLGYDDNCDGEQRDWHGQRRLGLPTGVLGSTEAASHEVH